MKFNPLYLLLFLTMPAYAGQGTMIGMVLTTVFVVVMLILYWMVVAEVGGKKKDEDDAE